MQLQRFLLAREATIFTVFSETIQLSFKINYSFVKKKTLEITSRIIKTL